MISTIERIQQLYEYHRKKADGLMIALAALNEDAIATKKVRAKGILDAAVTIDTQRVNGTHSPLLLTDGTKKRGSYRKRGSKKAQERLATVEFLKLFSTTEPRRPNHPRMEKVGGIAKLIGVGYLKAKGTNKAGDTTYVLTKKVYQGFGAPSAHNKHQKALQRLLWKYSTKASRTIALPHMQQPLQAILVRDGYLQADGDGYIRTEKRFSLT